MPHSRAQWGHEQYFSPTPPHPTPGPALGLLMVLLIPFPYTSSPRAVGVCSRRESEQPDVMNRERKADFII